MVRSPVVVIGTPRSGTSLTAGLIALHGVWTGLCRAPDERNPKGYFENRRIYALRKRGTITPRNVRQVLADEGWDGGPWLVKHGPESWEAWLPFAPKFVLCRRDPEASARSWMRHRPGTLAEGAARAREHQSILDSIRDDHGGRDFRPETAVNGDWGPFARICGWLGLRFDRAACEAFLDRDLWHQ